jgi:hypothetical protein
MAPARSLTILGIREQRLVQVGALWLGLGFVLQALAYVVGLHSARWGAAAAAVLIVAVTILIGTRIAHHGLPRYVTLDDERAVIEDQRHVFQVASLDDYWELMRLWVRQKTGRAIVQLDDQVQSQIMSGRWVAHCPRCTTDAMAWPENPDAVCIECGVSFRVVFPEPERRRRIERLLLQREHVVDRLWYGNESAAQVARANQSRGLPNIDDEGATG